MIIINKTKYKNIEHKTKYQNIIQKTKCQNIVNKTEDQNIVLNIKCQIVILNIFCFRGCLKCMIIYQKHFNVLQYRESKFFLNNIIHNKNGTPNFAFSLILAICENHLASKI